MPAPAVLPPVIHIVLFSVRPTILGPRRLPSGLLCPAPAFLRIPVPVTSLVHAPLRRVDDATAIPSVDDVLFPAGR